MLKKPWQDDTWQRCPQANSHVASLSGMLQPAWHWFQKPCRSCIGLHMRIFMEEGSVGSATVFNRAHTSYSLKGTTTPNAHTIQKGLYARNKSSVYRLAGEVASHRGFCAAAKQCAAQGHAGHVAQYVEGTTHPLPYSTLTVPRNVKWRK